MRGGVSQATKEYAEPDVYGTLLCLLIMVVLIINERYR
jgi:hypothetical protein